MTPGADDLEILDQLNRAYIRADQLSDFKRLDEFLAKDFIAQIPGVTLGRAEYLEHIAEPRLYGNLDIRDTHIRFLSDVALIHGCVTYTMLDDDVRHEALYTHVYQKREGSWVCVAACAIAPRI